MSDILLSDKLPEYEIRIKGRSLVRIGADGINIDGTDFHRDMRDLSEIRDILSRVLGEARLASRPRLICESAPKRRIGLKKSA